MKKLSYIEEIQKRGTMKALAFCAYTDLKHLKRITSIILNSIKQENCFVYDGYIIYSFDQSLKISICKNP